MYTKIFKQMYDGTLVGSNHWHTLVTFQQMLILADPEGVVDMTPEAMSRTTGIPVDVLRSGIAELMKPDTNSRTPDHEGRRIIPLDDHRDWGWSITNFTHYRDMVDNETRRAYFRKYKSEYRKNKKLRESKTDVDGPQCPQMSETNVDSPQKSTMSTYEDVYVNEDIKKKTPVRLVTHGEGRFPDFWSAWPANKRKVGRKVCLDKWRLHKLDSIADEVIAHVTAMKATEQWVEYAPAPLTYLNQRRWQDGVPQDAQPAERAYF